MRLGPGRGFGRFVFFELIQHLLDPHVAVDLDEQWLLGQLHRHWRDLLLKKQLYPPVVHYQAQRINRLQKTCMLGLQIHLLHSRPHKPTHRLPQVPLVNLLLLQLQIELLVLQYLHIVQVNPLQPCLEPLLLHLHLRLNYWLHLCIINRLKKLIPLLLVQLQSRNTLPVFHKLANSVQYQRALLQQQRHEHQQLSCNRVIRLHNVLKNLN